MIQILFSADRNFLGEVLTARGAMERLTLSQEGEERIGADCQRWLLRGVPIGDPVAYVQLRQPVFCDAVEQWSRENNCACIRLDPAHLACWELLAKLPLQPSERFAFLFALSRTAEALLPLWRHTLKEADVLVQHTRRENEQTISHLQKRLANQLSRSFVPPIKL